MNRGEDPNHRRGRIDPAAWIGFCRRNRWAILALALLGVLASLQATRRLRVDAGLESLLPKGSPTFLALEETRRRYGGADLFTISIVAPSPQTVAAVQDSLQAQMRRDWHFASSIQTGREMGFFRDKALLLLPVPQLKRIEDRLTRLRDELRLDPFGIGAMSRPRTADSSWVDASALRETGLPDEAIARLLRSYRADAATSPSDSVPFALRERMIGRLSDGRYVGLVQCRFDRPSSDIEFAREVTRRCEALLNAQRHAHPGLEVGVEGPFKDVRAVDSLQDNGAVATVISVFLTLGLMVLAFRAAGPIVLVLGQATVSCLLTVAFAALTYGRLNLYTMFVIAILFGMGTDYSFYVIGYARRRVREGGDWEEALTTTFRDLSGSLLLAWVTTTGGLLVLLLSRFPGYHEFGVIAAAGITSSLALTWLLLPAGVFAALDLAGLPGLGWMSPDRGAFRGSALSCREEICAWPRRLALGCLVATLALVPFISRLGFEYDFARLEDTGTGYMHTAISRLHSAFTGDRAAPATRMMPVKEALGGGPASSQPVVVLAPDVATMDRVQALLAQRHSQGDTLLAGFLTLHSFLPDSQTQMERLAYMHRIGELARDPMFLRASGRDSMALAQLRTMAAATPYGMASLPEWAKDLLRERDGTIGRTGLVYNNILTADARLAAAFQDRYAHLDVGAPVSCFASNFVYADLVRMLREDGIRMSWAMALVLGGLMVLIFRRWRPILVGFLGMGAVLGLTLGSMGLLDVRLNAFNLIVITTLQAALTDVVLYLILAWERQGRRDLGRLYSEMGILMGIAIGTTLSGYAGMLFTSHQGICSIGAFAVIGLGCCLAGSLALVPWLCSRLLPPAATA